MAKEEVKKEAEVLVVNELPQQPIRSFTEEGKDYNLVTINEALKEILEGVRKLQKLI